MFLTSSLASHSYERVWCYLCLSLCLLPVLANFTEISTIRTFFRQTKHVDRSGLCENQTLSCSHQVPDNVTEDQCVMVYHKNSSSVCTGDFLKGDSDEEGISGQMRLSSYLYKDLMYAIPAFNVSFTNIKWERAFMRFIENELFEGKEVKTPSLCREFQVRDVPQNFTLFFDCLWAHGYDGKTYHLQYKAVTTSGDHYFYSYSFFVPLTTRIDNEDTNLEDWELFLIVDTSKTPGLIELKIQTAPPKFNVTEYKVSLRRSLDENRWVVRTWNLKPTSVFDQEVSCSYNTKSKPGKYNFTVEMIHPHCKKKKCYVSKSPCIIIVDMPEPLQLLIIVSLVILTPLLIAAYFMWRRKCDKELPPEPEGPPKMLMMYTPVSVEHVKRMMAVAEYLKETCKFLAMIDQIDIPLTDHKDPVRWYIDSFNECHFVGIFASPETTPAEREEVRKFSRYLHIESIAQSHLRSKLISPGARCKFFCISLPGTSWETIPPEAQCLKRYVLPRDLDPLLILIGVQMQYDRGAGLLSALAKAVVPETPQETPQTKQQVPAYVNHSAAPPTPPTTPLKLNVPSSILKKPSEREEEDEDDDTEELASLSDQGLVSGSQPYLSDDGSKTSSPDQLSLLCD